LDYQLFFAVTTNIVMLPLLSFSLFIAYMNKRGFLERCGFDKPIIGMIIVGSLFGVLADVPLIITGDSLLNINLGGALIPVIVSGAILYRKKINLIYVGIGTIVVSIMTYSVSRIEVGVGIASEFPYYFLPALSALLMALFLSKLTKKDETFSIPYAYAVGVLGTLIGADLVRIPELVQLGVLGSFGGAGVMDLVYLSGLIASVPLIFAYYIRYDYSSPSDPICRAKILLRKGRYLESKEQVLLGLKQEIRKAKKLLTRNANAAFFHPCRTSTDVLRTLGFSPGAIRDYLTLIGDEDDSSIRELRKDIFTGILLRNGVRKRLNDAYTSLPRRLLAYLIDIFVIISPFAIFFLYVYRIDLTNGSGFLVTRPVSLAVISLLISIQFLYFTLMEWYFGTTVGKALMGLRVLDEELNSINFVESAARNSGRYADMALAFYFVSLVLIMRSPERKRIGDHIAGTRVVKTK